MNVFGIGEGYAVASALAWAVAVVLFRKSGESLPPFALNLVKSLIAGGLLAATLLIFKRMTPPSMPPGDWTLTLLSGLLGIALGDTLYFRALNLLGASRMAVAQTLYSPFVILLSILFFAERLAPWQITGVALVLGGILMVGYAGREAALPGTVLLSGFSLAALSVFAMAVGIVLAKPLLARHDFLWIVFLRTAAGALGMLAWAAASRELGALWRAYRGVRDWRAILAGGVCGTYLAMMLWLAGYKYADLSIAAVLNELAAVFTLVLAVVFLRERVGARQVLGTLLAVCGVGLVVWR